MSIDLEADYAVTIQLLC